MADVLRGEGWDATLTGDGPDSGVDVFATKSDRRIAVQVKMYGGTSRGVNRATVMELKGVADYFECTGAILVTNGMVLEDAQAAADKLGIEIRFISGGGETREPRDVDSPS